jgi:hypothetical protein
MKFPHKMIQMSSLVLVILIAATCVVQAREAEATDVPVVRSGAEPADGLQVVRLEEMWRAGGEDDDIIFGHIFRAEGDAEGNIYLLDTQLSEVPVFSPDGEHVKTLSREGEGPGETSGPVDLTLMPDGNLGILQRFPGKIVKIDLEGTPLGNITIGDASEGGFNSLYTGRCKGDNLMLVGQYATMGDNRQTRIWFAATYDAEGAEQARLWERTCVIDFTNPVIRELEILDPAMFASTPGPDGRVYIAPDYEAYAIQVYDADGALDHVIERDFETRKRSDLETGRVQAVFDAWASQNPAGMATHVESMAGTITNLYVDDANRLWVENSRSGETGPDEAFLTFDVFDADGRFEKQVALVCEGNPRDDNLFWARDDMVVLVKGAIPAMYASMAGGLADNEEEAGLDEMEVVCYRIPR